MFTDLFHEIKEFLSSAKGQRFLFILKISGWIIKILKSIWNFIKTNAKIMFITGTVATITSGTITVNDNINQDKKLNQVILEQSQQASSMNSNQSIIKNKDDKLKQNTTDNTTDNNQVKLEIDKLISDNKAIQSSINLILDKPVEAMNTGDIDELKVKIQELEKINQEVVKLEKDNGSIDTLNLELQKIKEQVKTLERNVNVRLLEIMNNNQANLQFVQKIDTDQKTLIADVNTIKSNIATITADILVIKANIASIEANQVIQFGNYTMDTVQQIPNSTALTYVVLSKNANWQPNPILPLPAFDGQTLIFINNATYSTTIQTTNTNLSSALTLTTYQVYIGKSASGRWIQIS
jgi:hypothetical protein